MTLVDKINSDPRLAALPAGNAPAPAQGVGAAAVVAGPAFGTAID
jgi:hypothetical protein